MIFFLLTYRHANTLFMRFIFLPVICRSTRCHNYRSTPANAFSPPALCLSVCPLSIYLSVYVFVCVLSISANHHLCIPPPIFPTIAVRLSVCMYAYVYMYLHVLVSFYPFIPCIQLRHVHPQTRIDRVILEETSQVDVQAPHPPLACPLLHLRALVVPPPRLFLSRNGDSEVSQTTVMRLMFYLYAGDFGDVQEKRDA